MQNKIVNTSGKIWAFMNSIADYTVIRDNKQQMTLRLENHEVEVSVIVTLAYSKCTWTNRLPLWESL